MGHNGFFGQLSGNFTPNNGNLFPLIQEQCKDDENNIIIDYINKIGINHPIKDYDITLDIQIGDGQSNQIFALGKTGMLELEDVIIRYIKFLQTTDNCYIDYQYVPRI